ncbi:MULTISPECIES: hypothetical protein [Pseudoalteromonas]|nr:MULTISPECIES: hypothetical protein [Pseudoalteromonas]MBE0377741.1 hypothetical protein [Pseudoalteromonas prydzensis ACAM 620]
MDRRWVLQKVHPTLAAWILIRQTGAQAPVLGSLFPTQVLA